MPIEKEQSMKMLLLMLLTVSSSFTFASSGDLDCDFYFLASPANKQRFNKVIPIGAEASTYKLGNMYVAVRAELPENSTLSKILTIASVVFSESEDGNETASYRQVLVGDEDIARPYFSFSKPSTTLTDETEHYSVQCHRLDK